MPIDKNEIENMVWAKFPFSEGEKKCMIEKKTMNELRQSYRNRLYKEYQEEQKVNESKDRDTLQPMRPAIVQEDHP